MKRLAALLLLAATPAAAFTLITLSLTPATPLVWYTAAAPAASATPEGQDFVPRFLPYGLFGLDGGGSFFGPDSYQFDTITCGWDAPGVVSGATDVMRMTLVQQSDAGILCQCDLPGICSDAAGTEHTCSCGGIKYLTGPEIVGIGTIGQGYAFRLTSATNCGTNPTGMRCSIPFRK